MAVEKARGCGYRKVGGVYLVGSGSPVSCDRLPYEIVNCPTCGGGLKFSRAFTWLDWVKYAGNHDGCKENWDTPQPCPVCFPSPSYEQPYMLLWVGEHHYSPEEFIRESLQMGISRRIPIKERLPLNLHIGSTWVLFAHKHVIPFKDEDNKDAFKPAVFSVFRPSRVEKLIWESEATQERIDDLDKHGITAVVIPDGDKDHDPLTPVGLKAEEKAEHSNKMFFESLRNRVRSKAL